MAKTYQLKNDTGTINVEYLTDAFDSHSNFHVTEVRGLDSVDVQAGITFNVLPYEEQAFKTFATDNNLILTVWDDDTLVGDLVDTANILTYSFAEETGAATIDQSAKTVDIEVANGTDVSTLVATFTLSPNASADISDVAQVSGTTANDFTNPVVYTITSGLGVEEDWTVTVTVAAP